MKFDLKLRVNDKSVYECFLPEIEKRERSSVKLTKKKDHVEFEIKAEDATAFRATMNGLMKLLLIYEKMKVKYDG